MGNTVNLFSAVSSAIYSQKFYSKYAFIELVNDQNFGQIKVYRKRQLNFDYVMILDRYMEKKQLEELKGELAIVYGSFLETQQPMLLKVFNYEVRESSLQECNIPMTRLYIQYFNFTLGNLAQRHLQKGECFSYDQVLYILNSVIQTYQFISQINSAAFTCNINSIFLSPQGHLKFSPIRVRDFIQQPDAFCNALCNPTHKQTLSYQNSHKDFINQFKKLLSELLKLYKTKSYKNGVLSGQDIWKLRKLEAELNNARILNQIKKGVPKGGVDCLLIGGKSMSQTSYPTSGMATRERDGGEVFRQKRPGCIVERPGLLKNKEDDRQNVQSFNATSLMSPHLTPIKSHQQIPPHLSKSGKDSITKLRQQGINSGHTVSKRSMKKKSNLN